MGATVIDSDVRHDLHDPQAGFDAGSTALSNDLRLGLGLNDLVSARL